MNDILIITIFSMFPEATGQTDMYHFPWYTFEHKGCSGENIPNWEQFWSGTFPPGTPPEHLAGTRQPGPLP